MDGNSSGTTRLRVAGLCRRRELDFHGRMGRHWQGACWSGYAATGKALS